MRTHARPTHLVWRSHGRTPNGLGLTGDKFNAWALRSEVDMSDSLVHTTTARNRQKT